MFNAFRHIFRKNDDTQQKLTYGHFLLFSSVMNETLRSELIERLNEQPKPQYICGMATPKDLMHLSYGQLDDLHNASKDEDIWTSCITIVMGVDDKARIYNEDVNVVAGFANWIGTEVEKINKIFKSIKTTYTQEEINAGAREMNFGSFGVLDWYARRMGITNQNDVRDVAWVRIFNCMKQDNDRSEYEKRVRDNYTKSMKARQHGKRK